MNSAPDEVPPLAASPIRRAGSSSFNPARFGSGKSEPGSLVKTNRGIPAVEIDTLQTRVASNPAEPVDHDLTEASAANGFRRDQIIDKQMRPARQRAGDAISRERNDPITGESADEGVAFRLLATEQLKQHFRRLD